MIRSLSPIQKLAMHIYSQAEICPLFHRDCWQLCPRKNIECDDVVDRLEIALIQRPFRGRCRSARASRGSHSMMGY